MGSGLMGSSLIWVATLWYDAQRRVTHKHDAERRATLFTVFEMSY